MRKNKQEKEHNKDRGRHLRNRKQKHHRLSMKSKGIPSRRSIKLINLWQDRSGKKRQIANIRNKEENITPVPANNKNKRIL